MGTISTLYKGDMLFVSRARHHKLTVDAPSSTGGNKRGPTPPEVFIALLGSCVAATVADYSERKGIDVRGMEVVVSYDKAEHPARLVNIDVRVDLPGTTASELDLKALRQVAQHCLVQKIMVNLEEVSFEIVGEPVSLTAAAYG